MQKTCRDIPQPPCKRLRTSIYRALTYATAWAITFSILPSHCSGETLRTACGDRKLLSLLLDETWEPVSIEHPSVLCAFRRKSGGFPTATITSESRASRRDSSSDSWRAESILQSYRRVGLTDARISEARTVNSNGHSIFRAVVNYTNLGTSMTAVIAIVDDNDQTFTLTLLDSTESFPRSKMTLETAATSFRLEDSSGLSSQSTGPSSHQQVWIILGALLALTGAVWIGLKRLRRSS